MSSTPSNRQRLLELLADHALEGISAAEQAELLALLSDDNLDSLTFERLVASIAVSLNPQPLEPLPTDLQARIKKTAVELPQFNKNTTSKVSAAISTPVTQVSGIRKPSTPKATRREKLLWLFAAACCLGLIATWGYPLVRTDSKPQSLVARIDQSSDVVHIPWTGTDDVAAKGSRGEIVWSNKLQAGYLKVTGLVKNNPAKSQYQFWIFDATKDDRYPIDGGVFDIAEDGTSVLPIQAKLQVVKPAMFAVTAEVPGGVVVSARERVLLLAK
jgi:hypothetical protein